MVANFPVKNSVIHYLTAFFGYPLTHEDHSVNILRFLICLINYYLEVKARGVIKLVQWEYIFL